MYKLLEYVKEKNSYVEFKSDSVPEPVNASVDKESCISDTSGKTNMTRDSTRSYATISDACSSRLNNQYYSRNSMTTESELFKRKAD